MCGTSDMLHTGWCILSRTTAIPHMVRLEDALIYYLHVIYSYGTFLTHTTEVISCVRLSHGVE